LLRVLLSSVVERVYEINQVSVSGALLVEDTVEHKHLPSLNPAFAVRIS
jgi:hypothetical protein